MRGSLFARKRVVMTALVLLLSGAAVASAGKGGPSISTDGVVVFGTTNQGADGTYRMNPDGSGVALLTSQWYPNDVSRGQSPVTILVNWQQDIYAMRADGAGAPVPLLVSSTIETQLRFSADGARIAYGSVTVGSPNVYAITVADVVRDGANQVTGMANAQVVWTSSGVAGPYQTRGLDFSRDGSMIVFAASASGNWELWALHLTDGTVDRLTNTAELEQYPRCSPVDDRIAFQRLASLGDAGGSIVTLDYGTGAVKVVMPESTRQRATFPCWSPDAAHILALVGGYRKPLDLYQFPSTGGNGVNVTSGLAMGPNTPCWGW